MRWYGLIGSSLAAALLCGCAAAPPAHPGVDTLRARLDAMERDPAVGPWVPVAMVEADRALRAAENAVRAGEPEEIAHQLYLAGNRVEIARAQAQRRLAENRMRELTRQEGPVMLLPRPPAPAEDPQRQQLAALQAQQTPQGWRLALGSTSFDRGKADLAAGAEARLAQLGAFLAKYPQRRLIVEGYTDSRGRDLDNLALSQRRADAVKAWLVKDGIAAGRVQTLGRGENFPVGDNATEEGRRLNRRVEILIPD